MGPLSCNAHDIVNTCPSDLGFLVGSNPVRGNTGKRTLFRHQQMTTRGKGRSSAEIPHFQKGHALFNNENRIEKHVLEYERCHFESTYFALVRNTPILTSPLFPPIELFQITLYC